MRSDTNTWTPDEILLLAMLFDLEEVSAHSVASWWQVVRTDALDLGWRLHDHPEDPHLIIRGTEYDLINPCGPAGAPVWRMAALDPEA